MVNSNRRSYSLLPASVCFFVLFTLIASSGLTAQENFVLSGYVRDAASGEELIGANVFLADAGGKGAVTNTYGFYSLPLPAGQQQVIFSYLGYVQQVVTVNMTDKQRLNIDLVPVELELDEVVVRARAADANVQNTEMGTVTLPIEQAKNLPVLFGEVDVLKTIQLLPGVLSAGEGNAGFYVRGGGPDQNLVLLDEAVVYNSGHLLGFFSVFNADAIKNTTLIKGGMPASYGGRLSSVVDIQMKEGNDKSFQADGGVGLIASRLTFQGPLVKEKSSFIISGRRTYALDLAQPFLEGTDFEGTNYYFYDLNAKVNYRFSDQDRLYFSTYFGRDVLTFRNSVRDFSFRLPYGNATATLRWNHLFSDRLFMNVAAIYNDYDFGFEGGQAEFEIDLFSGVRDYNAKVDFDFFPGDGHFVKFGANYTYHRLTPSVATATDGQTTFSNELQARFAHEGAIYLQDDWTISSRLSINPGIRLSVFNQLGPYAFEGEIFDKNEPVKTYWGFEPRISGKYSLDARSSLKFGITVANQYLHLVSNSTTTLPTDIWVPSSRRVKPQIGIQYALGYFRNFADNLYETSVEVYYKDLRNQIDYRENYVNNIADDLEQEFVFGDGRAYGVELFVKKTKGRLNGWLGYTLSRTERQFPDINEGRVFPAIYDRRHDLSTVVNYQLNKKWSLGSVFVFGSGNAFTPIRSLYLIDQSLVQEFGARNSSRLPDYHRLDFSATWTPRPDARQAFTSSWTFSVYNLYSRLNPFFVYYDFETDIAAGTAQASGFQVALFPIVPSITWNFSWQP